MNDVPLIKTNSINDINTSLIAIKKQLKQINEAVGLIDIPSVDTSSFVKKSDVVDTVESGNLNPVTSNAVAESCCRFPDYANPITVSSVTWIATVDCYITVLQIFNYSASTEVYIDGNVVSVTDSETGLKVIAFNGYVKKGQRVYYDYLANTNICKIFPLI